MPESGPPAEPQEQCPLSERADGGHSWRFDGDDPYAECVFCGEYRDALSGRVIRPGATEGRMRGMSGDATLEAIDGALRDWGMSQDAMRWTPEPASVGDGTGRPQMLVTIDTSQAAAALQHLSRQLQQLATTTSCPASPVAPSPPRHL